MDCAQTFTSSMQLSGRIAGWYAHVGLSALGFGLLAVGFGFWWMRGAPLIVFIGPGVVLALIFALGLHLSLLGAWIHWSRAEWHLIANSTTITKYTQTAKGWIFYRQRVEVAQLQNMVWIDEGDDSSAGIQLRTLSGKVFLIPAGLAEPRDFAAFVRRNYPNISVADI